MLWTRFARESLFSLLVTIYSDSRDQLNCFPMPDLLQKSFAVFYLLLGGPALSQPMQAVPIRTFPPGVQVDSPVPINRGDDSPGIGGFREPDQSYGANSPSQSTSLPNVEETEDSVYGSDSMFGYEKKKLDSDEDDLVDNSKDSKVPVRAGADGLTVDTAVFGSEADDNCTNKTSSSFCSAFY